MKSKKETIINTPYSVYTDSNNNRYMKCQNSIEGGKYFKGQICNEYVKVSERTYSVLCPHCTQQVVDPPAEKLLSSVTKEKSIYPRGWKFMRIFVDKDYNVYHKGIEQPELFNTLQPTDLDELNEKFKQNNIERQKIKKEKIELHKIQYKELSKNIIEYKKQLNILNNNPAAKESAKNRLNKRIIKLNNKLSKLTKYIK